ncbi:hypothetical protein [Umezawaea beigongshangensis]|uniref:hypothetical protein n=1 Tax=Umezawaea beigongshangensis TaxID=2780383 RepID=UPI0018F18850|nr:hypothetical protein [Umezawaea beigongshangensis]
MRVFVGRNGLVTLVDRLTEASGAGNRPVLVVEGCGGSGRTTLLHHAQKKWQHRTATALVSPGRLKSDENRAVRPVLAATMLGLSVADAPGYRLVFERVLLAEIAIGAELGGIDPGDSLAKLREAINRYRDRDALTKLVHGLLEGGVGLVANLVPAGLAAVLPTLVARAAEVVVDRLRRSRRGTRLTWSGEALDWFGHQDQGLPHNGEQVLIQLGDRAHKEEPALRREVDDLLAGALLADLRHSVTGLTDRPWNVLVLLDDGDSPAAAAFTTALLRARRALADTHGGTGPDPLTLVTTSGGVLVRELAGGLPAPAVVAESEAAATEPAGTWLRVLSEDLRLTDVENLTKNHFWPNDLAGATVAGVVHGLTRGHPESTSYVLRRLHDEPALVHDFDRLLRSDGPTPGVPAHRHLLRPFVRGHRGRPDSLLDALVTLSAARDRLEAQGLADLLPDPITLDSPLFTHPTLWTGPGPTDRLHPLARYLGLRALADDPDRWTALFGRLRASAHDKTAELRHARLLGDRDAVAAQLVELLRVLPTDQWLARFDVITEDPDPRERDVDVVRGVGRPKTPVGHAYRLLGVVPAACYDPCWTEEDALSTFHDTARQAYAQLSEVALDSGPLLERARRRHGTGVIAW